jgi:hypothetical protein
MPESKGNFIVHGLTGTFPGIGTFHRRGNKTFLRKIRAKPSVPDSDKQSAVKQRFAQCIKYARAAIKDPVIKAAYSAAAKPGKSAFNRAFSDAFYPPKINTVKTDNYQGRPGDSLTVEVIDDFKVAAVHICIHDATFRLIEQGDAVMQVNEIDWLYVATAVSESPAGTMITATATDLPGNITTHTVKLS